MEILEACTNKLKNLGWTAFRIIALSSVAQLSSIDAVGDRMRWIVGTNCFTRNNPCTVKKEVKQRESTSPKDNESSPIKEAEGGKRRPRRSRRRYVERKPRLAGEEEMREIGNRQARGHRRDWVDRMDREETAIRKKDMGYDMQELDRISMEQDEVKVGVKREREVQEGEHAKQGNEETKRVKLEIDSGVNNMGYRQLREAVVHLREQVKDRDDEINELKQVLARYLK